MRFSLNHSATAAGRDTEAIADLGDFEISGSPQGAEEQSLRRGDPNLLVHHLSFIVSLASLHKVLKVQECDATAVAMKDLPPGP